MKVVCARVDGKDQRMPAGSKIRSCAGCDHPIWVSPSTIIMMENEPTASWRLLCMTCKPPLAGDVAGLPPGQRAELEEVGINPDQAVAALRKLGVDIKEEP